MNAIVYFLALASFPSTFFKLSFIVLGQWSYGRAGTTIVSVEDLIW